MPAKNRSSSISSSEHTQTAQEATGRRLSPVKFIGITLGGFAVLMAAHVGMGAASIGRGSEKSADVCVQVQHRIDLADSIEGKRVFLVGGSGTRAGLSAEMFSEELGVRAINFGFLASLGPELILSIVKQAARPGDTIITFLEYPQLSMNGWNEIALDIAMACMMDTVVDMGPTVLAQALVAAGPKRLYRVLTEDGDFDSVEKGELNPWADRLPESFEPLSENERLRVDLYGPIQISVPEDGWSDSAIRDFVAWGAANDVAVYASWPNTIDMPDYDDDPAFARVVEFYESRGMPFIDTPNRGLYPRSMFYDTQYHMNYDGIRVRTQALIDEIRAEGILQQD